MSELHVSSASYEYAPSAKVGATDMRRQNVPNTKKTTGTTFGC